MTPLEPHEKVLVSKAFLDTDHGEVECDACHGGDPAAKEKKAAHSGFDPHPSINNPEKACGDCHEEIVASAKSSLHATLSTFPTILKTRSDMSKWAEIDKARKGHCAGCHTSCGGCHVSRPKFAKKGFVNGHVFKAKADPVNQCTACHGSRVGHEYYGTRGQGDAHAAKKDMDCVSCHGATEMHAAAPEGLKGRYHLKEMPACADCHKDLKSGPVEQHATHIDKVQCQVCHSQTYVNCYSCHTGMDDKGIRYFQNQRETEAIKIGRNYDPDAPGATYKYMLVRHEPTDPDLFAHYVKDAFTNFDNTPNWKRTSPHNIQRKTWQTASCNNCHGNRDLFLSEKDLLDYEVKANAPVVVADKDVPPARKDVKAVSVDTSGVRSEMVVSPKWLHDNLKKKDLVIIDVRGKGAYKKGHIKGAIRFDPLRSKIRTGSKGPKPNVLVSHEKIAATLGPRGISPNNHVVVYGVNGEIPGFLFWILEYAGVEKVSYLDGGIEGWHEAGYHLDKAIEKRKAVKFKAPPKKEYVVTSGEVQKMLDKPDVLVVDVRLITQAKGLARHALASRAGAIPGSINLPLGALYMDNGFLKPADELLWMLAQNGITRDKKIITTCNTGIQAGAAYMAFRRLGFKNVAVHDESWITWCAMVN